MKRIVIVCGAIAGFIAGGWMVLFIALGRNNFDFDKGALYGYTAMILAFSLVFVGIKNYRDNHLGGFISFGKAMQVGMLIVMIASTIYVAAWLVDYYYFVTDFADKYTAHEIAKLKASGASTAQIAQKASEMAKFTRMYANPFINALLTYTEIVPVGLIVSLLASLMLKRKAKADGFSSAIS